MDMGCFRLGVCLEKTGHTEFYVPTSIKMVVSHGRSFFRLTYFIGKQSIDFRR